MHAQMELFHIAKQTQYGTVLYGIYSSQMDIRLWKRSISAQYGSYNNQMESIRKKNTVIANESSCQCLLA